MSFTHYPSNCHGSRAGSPATFCCHELVRDSSGQWRLTRTDWPAAAAERASSLDPPSRRKWICQRSDFGCHYDEDGIRYGDPQSAVVLDGMAEDEFIRFHVKVRTCSDCRRAGWVSDALPCMCVPTHAQAMLAPD